MESNDLLDLGELKNKAYKDQNETCMVFVEPKPFIEYATFSNTNEKIKIFFDECTF